MLTIAGNDDLVRAGLVFLAWIRRVAYLLTRMAAGLLGFPTRLLALAVRILAFTRPVASLATDVGAAFELAATNFTAFDIFKPALLVFQRLLAADATLFYQKWTLWARFIVLVTIMSNLRVSAALWSLALVTAWRWAGAAG